MADAQTFPFPHWPTGEQFIDVSLSGPGLTTTSSSLSSCSHDPTDKSTPVLAEQFGRSRIEYWDIYRAGRRVFLDDIDARYSAVEDLRNGEV